jgi:hypothetical protein
MKALLLFLISFTALATETIIVNSNQLIIPDTLLKGAIVLERNIGSPSIVELTLPSNKQKECVKHETKQVYGEHSSCGSYTVPECRNEEYNCESRVHCTMPSELFGCQMEEWYKVCQNRVNCTESTRNVSCYHDAEVCVEYKEKEVAPKKTTLIFKLKKLQMKKTHLIRLTLNGFNGLSVYSPELNVEYKFAQSAWVLSK